MSQVIYIPWGAGDFSHPPPPPPDVLPTLSTMTYKWRVFGDGDLYSADTGGTLVTVDGDAIGRAIDPINAYSFYQATAAKRPVLRTNSMNGHRTIDFTAATNDGDMIHSYSAGAVNAPWTVWTVIWFEEFPASNWQMPINFEGGGGAHFDIRVHPSTHALTVTAQTGTIDPSFTPVVGSKLVMEVVVDGASSSVTINGATTPGTLATNLPNNCNLALGAWWDTSFSSYFGGKMADTILATGNDATERAAVRSYLASRYGI